MKKITRGSIVVAAVAAVTIVLASPAQAYTIPNGHDLGEDVGVANGAGIIDEVDMNVGSDGSNWYHEYDLTYTAGVDGTIAFTGIGKQFDNNGETIDGVIDTINHKLTFTARYYGGSGPDDRVWSVTDAVIGETVGGVADWQGNWNGINWTGSIKVPTFDPAPVVGNHGQYVSGAAKAGVKGKELAAIAKNGSLVGPYQG